MNRTRNSRSFSRRSMLRAGAAVAAAYTLAPGILRAQATPLKIGIAPGATEFLWTVLKARKLDQKHGLDVQIDIVDAAALNNALFSGQIPLGNSQPIPAAIANNAGKDIIFFAPSLWNHNIGVTYANSPGGSLKDFVGKKIATLPPLSGTYTSTQVLAAELGLNFEKDFQLVTAPPPAVLAFLARGDVDGIIHFEPFVSTLLITGKYKPFLESNRVWRERTGGNMPFAGLAANRGWLDANRDAARRLVAAALDAARLVQADASVFTEHAKVLNLKTPEEIAAAAKRLPQFYPTEWNEANAASTRRVIERAAELGIVKVPGRDFITVL